jgi:hypothetical protein
MQIIVIYVTQRLDAKAVIFVQLNAGFEIKLFARKEVFELS